jgi:hypothetical protein
MADEWIEAGGGDGDTPTWDRTGTVTGKLTNKQSNVGPNNSMLYTVQTDNGAIGIWGSTVLDTKFEQIPVGSLVRVEALGKEVSPKTKREYMNYKVMYKPGEATPLDPVQAVQEVMPGAEEVI